jgi:hypothetical protein
MALQLLRGLQPVYGYDEFESESSHPPWPQSKYYLLSKLAELPDDKSTYPEVVAASDDSVSLSNSNFYSTRPLPCLYNNILSKI